ncbi:tetratricopeptide repeat protein [bacterium]|nr:tetratricopeptide repeat protein [bacterium]
MKKQIIQFLLILLYPMFMAQGQNDADIIDLIEKGQTEKARQLLFQIDEDQIEPDLRLLLQGWLSTNGDSAITCYENLIQTYPNSQFSDDALFKLAQLKYAQGLYLTAQKQFSELMTDYPRSGLHQNCVYWIGLCYQATGKMDSAHIQFQKALREYPTTALSSIIQQDLTALEQEQSAEMEKSLQTPHITYAVQVGAFTHQNNALLRSQFFEDKGYEVSLRTKRQDGTTYYLVWIGSFDSDMEARAFGEELKRRWDVNYTLVSE